jgi:NADH-quinone oxidoreductase subunit I
VNSEYKRGEFIYGKDKLVEPVDKRVDVTKRQTERTLEFKKHNEFQHNQLYSKGLKK